MSTASLSPWACHAMSLAGAIEPWLLGSANRVEPAMVAIPIVEPVATPVVVYVTSVPAVFVTTTHSVDSRVVRVVVTVKVGSSDSSSAITGSEVCSISSSCTARARRVM